MSDKEYVVKTLREAHKCAEKELAAHQGMHESPFGKSGFQQTVSPTLRDTKIANEANHLIKIERELANLKSKLEKS